MGPLKLRTQNIANKALTTVGSCKPAIILLFLGQFIHLGGIDIIQRVPLPFSANLVEFQTEKVEFREVFSPTSFPHSFSVP